jgi:hypothetical protein
MASTSEELASQADELRGAIDFFKTDQGALYGVEAASQPGASSGAGGDGSGTHEQHAAAGTGNGHGSPGNGAHAGATHAGNGGSAPSTPSARARAAGSGARGEGTERATAGGAGDGAGGGRTAVAHIGGGQRTGETGHAETGVSRAAPDQERRDELDEEFEQF